MPTEPNPSNDVTALPLLPLRDVVVFPHMVIPLFVGRPKSIKALDVAMDAGKHILLVAQKLAAKDDPVAEDLYDIGSVATVLQMLKLPDGTVKVLVEGTQRARILKVEERGEYLAATAQPIPGDPGQAHEVEAMRRALLAQFDQYVKLNKKIPPEILTSMSGIDDGGRLADAIAAHLPLKLEQKQQILEMSEVGKRLEHLLGVLEGEVDILQVEKRIRGRVKRQMEKSQREYYLNEQVKAIQKELGEGDENADLDEMEKKIKAARMSKEAEGKAMAEMKKLRMMSPMSAEATVVRNYIDTLLGLPWRKKSKISKDLAHAVKVLDADHYGLEKVKERIVEYLAVQQRVERLKGPILCLVGPPGVGKTSLGQSIARAMNRKFVRASLGGVHDEAEIRGHRRTYIGALPGNIIQAIRKAGSRDCVMMLDEIDKLGAGIQGDPASALLEVLDPEQNSTFRDNYLAVPFDLSHVVFITTANMLDTIPGPLRDRMEVISLAGYTAQEKLQIARRYLLRRQMEANGVKPGQVEISDEAIRDIIQSYTREAGVRGLEREIGKVMRHCAVRLAEGEAGPIHVGRGDLAAILGPPQFESELAMRTSVPGVATGLAWTPVGGDILFIEATRVPGNGKLILTGQLGEVMRESAQAALSIVKGQAASFGIDKELFEKSDVHIHVPAGATPKDGPSAGVAMYMALVSLMSIRTVRSDTAMTGEVSLRGLVLPVGGIKEKVVAAHRAGIKRVMLPARNKKDYEDIPEEARKGLDFIWLERVDDAVAGALEPQMLDNNTTVKTASAEAANA